MNLINKICRQMCAFFYSTFFALSPGPAFLLATAMMMSWGVLSGCASTPAQQITGAPIDPEVRAEQESEIRKADDALFLQDFISAERLYSGFLKQYPNSIFFQRALFGKGKALEAQERWSEAAEAYRTSVEATRVRLPEIAAQALFRLSFCYENLGDEARVLASLNDAMAMKSYLHSEQVLAEIPARYAACYSRMGRIKDAQVYFLKADQGVAQIRATRGQNVTNAWLAQVYFHMGRLSTNQISDENLQTSLDTLKMIQVFSLRSAEMGGEPWSRRAIQGLMENYRDHWNTIQEIPLHRALEAGVAKREQVERKINFTGQLLTMISDLRQYRAPSDPLPVNDLFSFLQSLEKQGRDFLISVGDRNGLTPESERRLELKRQKMTLQAVQTGNLPKNLPSKKVQLAAPQVLPSVEVVAPTLPNEVQSADKPTESRANSSLELTPETRLDKKPDAKPDTKSNTKQEAKPDAKPDAKPETQAEPPQQ